MPLPCCVVLQRLMAEVKSLFLERSSVVLAQAIPSVLKQRDTFIPYGRGYFETLRRLQGKDKSDG